MKLQFRKVNEVPFTNNNGGGKGIPTGIRFTVERDGEKVKLTAPGYGEDVDENTTNAGPIVADFKDLPYNVKRRINKKLPLQKIENNV
jgi:hypothetical protein